MTEITTAQRRRYYAKQSNKYLAEAYTIFTGFARHLREHDDKLAARYGERADLIRDEIVRRFPTVEDVDSGVPIDIYMTLIRVVQDANAEVPA